MNANKLEGKARELLAQEYEREGFLGAASCLRHPDTPIMLGDRAAIRAIQRGIEYGRALDTARQSEGMVPEEVRLAVKMLDIGQSFALCNHAHEDTRRDIKKLRPEIDCIKAWVDSLAAAPADAGEGKV